MIPYPNDKILLIKRDTLPFKGFWALPGGRMDSGETVEQTCIREVKEETGLEVEIIRKIGDYHEQGSREGVDYDYYPACFVVKVVGGQISKQECEIQDVGFFSLDGLPCPLAFEHDQMVLDYKKTLNL
jgi:8-oxo-dGTP diphosphatase